MKVRPPFALVAVEWDDASTDHGWEHADDAADTSREFCLTVGFLYREDEHYLYLCSTCDEQRNTNSRMKIPRGMVATRTEVTFPQRRGHVRRSKNADTADTPAGLAEGG